MAEGENWIPPQDILDIFVKNKCHKSDIAKDLKIARSYLYSILNNNKTVKELFEQAQKTVDEQWVEKAENVMYQAIDLMKSKPAMAMRAAEYILERKGHLKGWAKPKTEELDDVATDIRAIAQALKGDN